MNFVQLIAAAGGQYAPPKPITPQPERKIPPDLMDFYQQLSSVVLFADANFTFHIINHADLMPADHAVMGQSLNDPETQNWYTIAQYNEAYIAIDLSNSENNGKCYDAFFDVYETIDHQTTIATSFTDFLKKRIASEGKELYWTNG